MLKNFVQLKHSNAAIPMRKSGIKSAEKVLFMHYKGLNQFKMMKRMFNMRYMTPVPPEMIMGLLMFVYLWKGNEKEAFFRTPCTSRYIKAFLITFALK